MLSKLPNVEVSIFSKMSTLASEYGAINLAQGFPEYSGPELLSELVNHFMQSGKNQYAPSSGVLQLRVEISKLVETCYNRKLSAESQIVITSGATQALFTGIQTLVFPGDEVVIFEPAYDSYEPVIELFGGIAKPISMEFPEFRINWENVKNLISSKTKLIIINNPHNPTGSILKSNDLETLIDLCNEYKNLYILADEVYEHLVHSHCVHLSIHRYNQLHERSLIVSSFGKTFHNTGWKVGYIAGPERLIHEFNKIHQFTVFSVNTPIQFALAEFMKQYTEYNMLYQEIQDRKTLVSNMLHDSNFNVLPNSSTYFQLIDYSLVSSLADIDFAMDLVKNAGVAVIPLTPFYSSNESNHHVVRICVAKSDNTLVNGIHSLNNYVSH